MEDSQTRFDSERLDARLEQVREALSGASQDAEHLQRLATVGTIAGLIAHEFRNLMTPVRSYAQLALRRPDDAQLTIKALEAAMHGAAQAAAIAESLLELTGARSGGGISNDQSPAVSFGWCHVEHAVNGMEIACRECLEQNSVMLDIELEPGLRASMPEPDLLQVLLNLVQNAARSMPNGGAVRVRGRCETDREWNLASDLGGEAAQASVHLEGEWGGEDSDENGRTVIEVIDEGCGISGESLSRVFEPFVSGGGGRGMGLATCRALVGKAGGRLGAASGEGFGTRFVIELPHS